MDAIVRVRRFNRAVTQYVGALHEDFLGRHRSLGASRLLFEIGAGGAEVRTLRARLGLDSGYTSRLLRGLEAEGLIHTHRSPDDRRARLVTLTARGHGELAELNRLSEEAASVLLEPLSATQREALVDAMTLVERLLAVSAVRFAVEPPDCPEARYCLESYFGELAERFDGGFDPSLSIPAEVEHLTPPAGFFVLASLHGEPVGCGALKLHRSHGEIKRMWVAPSARGLGLGGRVLDYLETLARSRGLRVLRLETNKALNEAQRLYRRRGYQEVPPFSDEPYADHWFEKRM